jgi:hypothetical protein
MAISKYITFSEQEEQKSRYYIFSYHEVREEQTFYLSPTLFLDTYSIHHICIFLHRNPGRLQWPCRILKKFQSMNWTHLNLSSEEARRSRRHVLINFVCLSSICFGLHVSANLNGFQYSKGWIWFEHLIYIWSSGLTQILKKILDFRDRKLVLASIKAQDNGWLIINSDVLIHSDRLVQSKLAPKFNDPTCHIISTGYLCCKVVWGESVC